MKFLGFFFCFVLTVFLSPLDHSTAMARTKKSELRLYDQPKQLSDEDATQLMFENLNLLPPNTPVFSPDDQTTAWSKIDDRSGETGLFRVKGAVDENPKLLQIDGSAKALQSPGGKPIGTLSEGRPVRLIKSKGPWKLVAKSSTNYVWVNEVSLREIPPKKLLLNAASPLLQNFPASVIEWQDLKKRIVEIKKNIEDKECPKDVSNAEKDRIIGVDLASKDGDLVSFGTLQFFRIQALETCNDAPPKPTPEPISAYALHMNVKKCECIEKEPSLGSYIVHLSKREWTEKYKGNCEKRTYYYSCFRDPMDIEGDLGEGIACPISCFSKI